MNMVDKIWDWWKDFVTNHFWKIYNVALATFALEHIFCWSNPVNVLFIGGVYIHDGW